MEYDEVIRVGDRVAFRDITFMGNKSAEKHGVVAHFARNRVLVRPDGRQLNIEVPTHDVRKLRIEELI